MCSVCILCKRRQRDSGKTVFGCYRLRYRKLNAETPQESLDALAVGDTVVLGKYDIDNNSENGEEDITWKVLDIENGKALIISELCIDATSYSTEKNDVTWETSALRQKLNFGEESLYETVFADDEKAYILLSEVANEDNASHDVDGGNATEDYLFALSIDETEKYFDSDDARIAKASAEEIIWTVLSKNVLYYGAVDNAGKLVKNDYVGVRPVITVDLTK